MLLPLYGSIRQRLLVMAVDPVAWTTLFLRPFLIGTVLTLMLRSAGRESDAAVVVVGISMVILFYSTVLGAAGSVDYERYLGTFPYAALSPAPLFILVWGKCLASALQGLAAALLVAGWTAVVFGVSLSIARPAALVGIMVTAVLVLSLFGTCLASLFVLSRAAVGLVNVVGYPVWILSGFFFPIDRLPHLLHPVAYALPTKWLMDLGRWAVLGAGDVPGETAWLVLLGMSLVGACVGWRLLHYVEYRARERATLTWD